MYSDVESPSLRYDRAGFFGLSVSNRLRQSARQARRVAAHWRILPVSSGRHFRYAISQPKVHSP